MELCMSTESKPYPAFDELIESLTGWLKHLRELNEMHGPDRADFDRIASELCVSSCDLEELIRLGQCASCEMARIEKPTVAPIEMPEMLNSVDIHDERLGGTYLLLEHDMEPVCARCCHRAECVSFLVTESTTGHYRGCCALEILDRDLGTMH
jgi:hypothetical protein